jgi:SAM-dependent methyltransferase
MTQPDKRHFAPAVERNRGPILEVLRRALPAPGAVLELASGTGEHAAYFAANLPHLAWQPSDADPEALESIDAWRASADLDNLAAPLVIDAGARDWPLPRDFSPMAVVSINMIHISPWTAGGGLIRGAARLLKAGGVLYFYGPFKLSGRHTAPSNADFDRGLRARNPDWGVRDLDDVSNLAAKCGFDHAETVAMPANNFSVIFRKL